jgi:hypothetical protein
MSPSSLPSHRRRGLRFAGPLLLAVPGLLPAQEPGAIQAAAAQALQSLRGSSLEVGAGYVQGTFKAGRTGTGPGYTEITDNGQPNLLLDYTGKERALARIPMRDGSFVLGWSLSATAGQFDADRQLINDAITGKDVGTSVRGQYAGIGPGLFVRMGPLYPGTRIFWSFGASVGAGAVHYQGNALFSGGSVADVGSRSGIRPALYGTAFWQMDLGDWVVVFNGKVFQIHDPDYSPVSYEIYGLSLGYRIVF